MFPRLKNACCFSLNNLVYNFILFSIIKVLLSVGATSNNTQGLFITLHQEITPGSALRNDFWWDSGILWMAGIETESVTYKKCSLPLRYYSYHYITVSGSFMHTSFDQVLMLFWDNRY